MTLTPFLLTDREFQRLILRSSGTASSDIVSETALSGSSDVVLSSGEDMAVAFARAVAEHARRGRTVDQLRDRIGLPDEPWATAYVTELVSYIEERHTWERDRSVPRTPPPTRPAVTHWRTYGPVLAVTRKGKTEVYPVDTEIPLDAVAGNAFCITDMTAPEGVVVKHVEYVQQSEDVSQISARSLEELERLSGAPRPARHFWVDEGLPKHRRPVDLHLAVACFYLARWQRMSLRAIEVRSNRTHTRVAQLVQRVDDMLAT